MSCCHLDRNRARTRYVTPCVKTAELPCSSISSSSSFVVALPAARVKSRALATIVRGAMESRGCCPICDHASPPKKKVQLTNFQLSLYSSFAPLSVVSLGPIVLGHHLDELTRQRRVLCLPYPEIGIGLVRLLLLLNVLFDTLKNLHVFSDHSYCKLLNLRAHSP